MIDDQELEDAVTARLEARIAAARGRREQQRTDRAERAHRRAYGLAQRHAAKLARNPWRGNIETPRDSP